MAITRVQSASGTTTATLGATATSGNLLIGLYTALSGTVSLPGGWIALESGAITGTRVLGLAYKFSDGTETAFAPTGGASMALAAIEYSHVKNEAPIHSKANSSSTKNFSTSLSPTAGLETLIVGAAAISGYSSNPLAPLAGFTEIYELADSATGLTTGMSVQEQIVPTASGSYALGATYTGSNRFEMAVAAGFKVASIPPRSQVVFIA